MGVNVSRGAALTEQISVRPAAGDHGNKLNSSIVSSMQNESPSRNHAQSQGSNQAHRSSSDDTLKKSTSRPSSSVDRSRASSGARVRSGIRMQPGSAAKQFSHHGLMGTHSRPISTLSSRQKSAKGSLVMKRDTLNSGLPLMRDIDIYDVDSSLRAKQKHSFVQESPEADVILLGAEPNPANEKPASCCQLCGNHFTNLGIKIPLLLLCGHSYCSNCLGKVCETYAYPAGLKCGVCSVITPLDQQTPDSLPQNTAILDLIGSKEYKVISSEKNVEKCAECEHEVAKMYCSECNASYCEFCGTKAHEGSKVRSRHKPVPINLKPRSQPTCKKHPGQSCVLYCETEKQPMCVLCKFYNQHRFHKFDLMSKVATKYCSSVSESLVKLNEIEKELDIAARSMFTMVDQINNSARKAQERLERHFTDMRKSYMTALEHREAVLLTLLDKQVEAKQEMLAEMRLEVAAARARVLAAKEEGTVLLRLNPLTALLSRKHLDLSIDRSLKETLHAPLCAMQPEVPLSLLPDITPSLIDILGQHGAVLQLPPRPCFQTPQIKANAISLDWKVLDQSTNVSSDMTLTFSLHCHVDVPFKTQVKQNFRKRYVRGLVTPESGFEDMSELSSESKNNFPSLPTSLLGSRNISLVRLQGRSSNQTTSSEAHSGNENKSDGFQDSRNNSKPTATSDIGSLLPEPIRLPKPASTTTEMKLPHLLVNSPDVSMNAGDRLARPGTNTATKDHTTAILNLPPLLVSNRSCESDTELMSITTSGVFGDSEEDGQEATSPTGEVDESSSGRMNTVGEVDFEMSQRSRTPSRSSLTDTSDELNESKYKNVGRFCHGYAFEEIYCGARCNFHYSGLVPGATYYFRVRCHNAAGWGLWSNTVKCMTSS